MAGISPAEMSRRLSKLTLPKLQQLMYQEIKEDETMLRAMKAQEFLRGERPTGKLIGNYRSPFYSRYKERLNPLASGHVDLIVTGAFVESAYLLKPRGNKYLFGFSDEKAGKLISRYGSDIQGLNQLDFDSFIKIQVAEHFIKAMKQYAKV